MDEENGTPSRLSTVRTLIERAEIYRAVFARSTLVTGFLSLLTAILIHLNNEGFIALGHAIRPRDFATLWVDVLLISIVAKIFFIWFEARRSGRPFFSREGKLALGQIAPFLLIPVAFTAWFFSTGYLGAQELNLVAIWIAFYGLILLSTAVFAARSIVLLGWAFLLTSLAIPSITNLSEGYVSFSIPNALMGLTFGLYNLVYALCNWPRKRRVP